MDLDVVVCAKNQAKMLERILQQVTAKIPFQKLIVIYASSADGTERIAREYTKNAFWDGDLGLGAARNLGIRKAKAKFVAMIDTDVIIPRNWYKRVVKHLEDPRVAAAMGTTIYGYGCLPIQRLFEYWRRSSIEGRYGCTNTIFKREIVLEIGNFDKRIRGAGEDCDLHDRLLVAGYKWIRDKEVIVYHPLSCRQYVKHHRWWAIASPYMNELVDQARTKSLFRVYCRSAFSVFDAALKGAKLSLLVHPSMIVCFPFLEAVAGKVRLEELRRLLKTEDI